MIGFVYADEPEAKTFFKKVDSSKKDLATGKSSAFPKRSSPPSGHII